MSALRIGPCRLQFRLRSLLLLIAIISAPLGVWAHRQHQYRIRLDAVGLLRRAGAEVTVEKRDSPYGRGDQLDDEEPRRALEPDDVVVSVDLVDTPVSDEMVSAMVRLPTLSGLYFENSRITKSQSHDVSKLPLVEELWLKDCDIGDDVVRHLARMRSLRSLSLNNTNI